jgi:predicted dehydrogenase
MKRKVRMGMIGGSSDAFIGNVHRMAAALDGQIELVCGAFSSNAAKSKETGEVLYLDSSRVYGSFDEMITKEKNLPADIRMDFVSVVTPNHLHFLPSKLALENGFHVLCEKPLAFSSKESEQLEQVVKKTGLVFGVTHNYTGYPMVKEARALVQTGKIGKIRKVMVEYPQGWLSERIEAEGQKQAGWRTDPKQAGISCCVGDIGTHAENLAEYITSLKITSLSADVSTFVEGRLLDDDATILVRFNNGAKGVIAPSQISSGEENELKIKVYGEKGGLEWLQSDPNNLILKNSDGPKSIIKTGAGKSYLSEHALVHTRLPGGHPEGYIEAMANIYRNFAFAVDAYQNKTKLNSLYDFPDVADGVRGMKFIEAVIESGKNNSKWITL